jgi:hypothetical protein
MDGAALVQVKICDCPRMLKITIKFEMFTARND